MFQFSATDDDSGNNGLIDYSLVWSQSQGKQLFEVREHGQDDDAEVYTLEQFDRENPEDSAVEIGTAVKYKVTVQATDRGIPPLSTTCFFLVEIEDVNDNQPVFDIHEYRGRILNTHPTNDRILRVFAIDDDVGINAEVTYHITEQSECSGCFTLEEDSGWLRKNAGGRAHEHERPVRRIRQPYQAQQIARDSRPVCSAVRAADGIPRSES